MGLTNSVRDRFRQAEELRRLRLQLAKMTDEQQRHMVLRQIEQLEEESKQV
jgi:hypothetical protein